MSEPWDLKFLYVKLHKILHQINFLFSNFGPVLTKLRVFYSQKIAKKKPSKNFLFGAISDMQVLFWNTKIQISLEPLGQI